MVDDFCVIIVEELSLKLIFLKEPWTPTTENFNLNKERIGIENGYSVQNKEKLKNIFNIIKKEISC